MKPEDVNDRFKDMMFRDMIEHGEALIRTVCELESKSRHEMSCNDDPVKAAEYADQAYALFMDTPLKLLPTIVMGIADRFNREHEAYSALLETVHEARLHLELADGFARRGNPGLAQANLECAANFLTDGLENAIYERSDDEPDDSQL